MEVVHDLFNFKRRDKLPQEVFLHSLHQLIFVQYGWLARKRVCLCFSIHDILFLIKNQWKVSTSSSYFYSTQMSFLNFPQYSSLLEHLLIVCAFLLFSWWFALSKRIIYGVSGWIISSKRVICTGKKFTRVIAFFFSSWINFFYSSLDNLWRIITKRRMNIFWSWQIVFILCWFSIDLTFSVLAYNFFDHIVFGLNATQTIFEKIIFQDGCALIIRIIYILKCSSSGFINVFLQRLALD